MSRFYVSKYLDTFREEQGRWGRTTGFRLPESIFPYFSLFLQILYKFTELNIYKKINY